MKNPRNKNRRRRKRPSKEAVRSAHIALDAMSKSRRQVHVMILLEPLILMFESTVEKSQSQGLELYILTKPNLNLDISVAPELSDLILFSDEGLLLGRKGVFVTLEPEERSAEELLAMYPGVTKVIQ